MQLQVNYADWESETVESRKCYEAARARNLPVVVMEPVKGGSLVKLPDDAAAVLRNAAPDEPLAAWALRFAASLPGRCSTVLSGMSTPAQVEEERAHHARLPPRRPRGARGARPRARHPWTASPRCRAPTAGTA